MPQGQNAIAEQVSTVKTLELVPHAFELPDIPQLRHVAKRIDAEDEAELRWFLGNPHVAEIAASSGAFGNQLEHAESFGFGSLPCRRCGGRWRPRRRAGKDTIVDWQDGTGQAPKDVFGKRVSYAAALAAYRVRMQRQHGIVLMSRPTPKPESGIDPANAWASIKEAFSAKGKRLMTDAEFRSLFDRLPENETRPCKLCDGIGIVPRRAAAHVEVTVWPKGSSRQVGGREGDDAKTMERKLARGGLVSDGNARVHFGELERYLAMRTVLADVARLSVLARVGIEEYYSWRSVRPSLAEAINDGAAKSGQRALELLVGARYGLDGAARMRAASTLRDFSCGCYQLAAYGAQ